MPTGVWDIDVAAIGAPDALAIDGLARLQLAAKRYGHSVRLVHACEELRGLIDLMGLSKALPSVEELDLEPGREAEQREQAGGVQEERDAGDLPS